MKRQKRRSLLMWGALGATLAATVWMSGDPQETELAAAAVSRPAVRLARAEAPLTLQQTQIRMRQPITQTPGDLFPADQGQEIVDSSSNMVMQPTMPAVPFQYAGRLIEGSVTTIFLLDGQQNLMVRAGDIIRSDWKVEAIGPQQIHLTYMPLQTAVTLGTGEEY